MRPLAPGLEMWLASLHDCTSLCLHWKQEGLLKNMRTCCFRVTEAPCDLSASSSGDNCWGLKLLSLQNCEWMHFSKRTENKKFLTTIKDMHPIVDKAKCIKTHQNTYWLTRCFYSEAWHMTWFVFKRGSILLIKLMYSKWNEGHTFRIS